MAEEKNTSDLETRKRITRRAYKRIRNARNWAKVNDGRYEISVGEKPGRRRWYQVVKQGDEFGRKNAGRWVILSGDICYAGPGAGRKPRGWKEWKTHSGGSPTLRAVVQAVAAYDLGMWGDHTPYHLDREVAGAICEELWRA